MTRMSAVGRAATAVRRGGKVPSPPPELNDEAAAIWKKVVADKPLGWFDAGSLPLLSVYCSTLARVHAVQALLDVTPPEDKGAYALEIRLMSLAGSCGGMAMKLRLSVQQTVERKSKMRKEKGPGEQAASDPLLGGRDLPGNVSVLRRA